MPWCAAVAAHLEWCCRLLHGQCELCNIAAPPTPRPPRRDNIMDSLEKAIYLASSSDITAAAADMQLGVPSDMQVRSSWGDMPARGEGAVSA